MSLLYTSADEVAAQHSLLMKISCLCDELRDIDYLRDLRDTAPSGSERIRYAKGWITRRYDHGRLQVVTIDDGTVEIERHLEMDRAKYPLIHNTVKVGNVLLLYHITSQFALRREISPRLGILRGIKMVFELHGGY